MAITSEQAAAMQAKNEAQFIQDAVAAGGIAFCKILQNAGNDWVLVFGYVEGAGASWIVAGEERARQIEARLRIRVAALVETPNAA